MSNRPGTGGGAYCPWCGGALQWAAEHGQWYCVRDQQWIHPQQLYQAVDPAPLQPQQGYPQQPQLSHVAPQPGYPAPPQAYAQPGHGRSRKGLVIGLVLAAIAVGVGVTLFFVLGGSGDGGRGAGSPDGLAKATMKAIEKQDPKALMQLSASSKLLEAVADCPDSPPQPDDELEAELRWKRVIRRTNKKELTVESVSASEESSFEPGAKIRDGKCKAKRKLSLHTIKLELASDDDERAKIYALKIDGRWYLNSVSGLPDRDLTSDEREEERVMERKARKKARAARRKSAAPLPSSLGASSATEAASKLIKAMQSGDASQARKLLPERSAVDLLFDCDPYAKLMTELELSRSRLDKEASKAGDLKFEVLRNDLVMSTKLEPGKEFKGCTAAAEGTTGEVRVTVKVGTTDDVKLIFEVVEIRGRWFLLSAKPRTR